MDGSRHEPQETLKMNLTSQKNKSTQGRRKYTKVPNYDRVEEIEKTEVRFDQAIWEELAQANLLGVALPEEYGGLGFGLLELCIVLEEHGRSVSPIPLLQTLAMGALPVAEFGSTEQKNMILPEVITGKCILTGAFQEWGIMTPTARHSS